MTAPLAAYGTHCSMKELPRVLQVGLKTLGVHEVVGRGSNKTILKWRDDLNAAAGLSEYATEIKGFSDDDIPWCGLWAAHVWFKAKKPNIKGPLWARNWAKGGVRVAHKRGGRLVFARGMKACLGDRLVFQRPGGGGHVGDYICETKTHYAVLGGNQGNKVSITKIRKSRCIAIRRPKMHTPPRSMQPVVVKSFPGRTSVNEA